MISGLKWWQMIMKPLSATSTSYTGWAGKVSTCEGQLLDVARPLLSSPSLMSRFLHLVVPTLPWASLCHLRKLSSPRAEWNQLLSVVRQRQQRLLEGVARMDFPLSVPLTLMAPVSTQIWSASVSLVLLRVTTQWQARRGMVQSKDHVAASPTLQSLLKQWRFKILDNKLRGQLIPPQMPHSLSSLRGSSPSALALKGKQLPLPCVQSRFIRFLLNTYLDHVLETYETFPIAWCDCDLYQYSDCVNVNVGKWVGDYDTKWQLLQLFLSSILLQSEVA